MDNAVWIFDEDGEIVIVKGRSYGADPFDYKETTKHQNMTSTEIHAKIAAFHGLTPVAPAKTTTFVGEYTGTDHGMVVNEMSHWNLIQMLARQEGYISQ